MINVSSKRWLATVIAALVVAGPASAEDARPQTDEKCIERCDTESDQCMADSEGEKGKVDACDDKYSKCLRACDAPGN
ncbi:MAG: hypothetical protein WBO00_04380 [Steroidobacteraceae bacterium]